MIWRREDVGILSQPKEFLGDLASGAVEGQGSWLFGRAKTKDNLDGSVGKVRSCVKLPADLPPTLVPTVGVRYLKLR